MDNNELTLQPGFKPLAEKVADLEPAFWQSSDLARISELISYAHAHNPEVGRKLRELYTDFVWGKYCYEYNALTGHPLVPNQCAGSDCLTCQKEGGAAL